MRSRFNFGVWVQRNYSNLDASTLMAEGEGFEPPDGLPHLLISSQMPLTTQPPFHSIIINGLQRSKQP